MNISKQVIVMRKSFVIDGKKITPRKGKYVAQGSHAVLGAILGQMDTRDEEDMTVKTLYMDKDSALHDWITGSFTKICCVVDTEEELLAIHRVAQAKGLITCLITDKGNTEFGGVPTITCCAIGPAWSDDLADITGHLELF